MENLGFATSSQAAKSLGNHSELLHSTSVKWAFGASSELRDVL